MHVDLTRVRVLPQVEAAQKGALSRAAAAEDCNHVVIVRNQRDALQHLEAAEALMQIFDYQSLGRFIH